MKACLLLALICTPARHVLPDRPVIAMFGMDVTVKTIDLLQTEHDYRLGGFEEHNPVLRPMLGHPIVMSGYAAGYALAAAFVGREMRRSRFAMIRKLWWMPQAMSITENVYGYAVTRQGYRR